jgi:DNA polymerase-3 subunit epsilon
LDGNPDGPLYGEVLVFTGSLDIPRAQAADIAANLGCRVAENVSKATALLVVGDQDIRALAGQAKSSKHRKAEEQIARVCRYASCARRISRNWPGWRCQHRSRHRR